MPEPQSVNIQLFINIPHVSRLTPYVPFNHKLFRLGSIVKSALSTQP